MAEYKDIKGYTIKVTDTDPLAYAGAWTSGGNINQARQSMGGAGTTTAGLVFGGGGDPPAYNLSEEYDFFSSFSKIFSFSFSSVLCGF